MVKVVVKSLRAGSGAKTTKPKSRRVVGPDGRAHDILNLDPASDSFGDDLLYAFRRNVARARRQNKALLGVPDFIPGRQHEKSRIG
jgi:hypothetical protein